MNFLIFILVYPLIWLLSILPMRVLYFISDIIFVILYYILGYRKKVVRNNLKIAFPERSSEELLIIEKKTFHHFIDIFMEMMKSFTISEKEIAKRFVFKNPQLINEIYKNGKSVILMAGHYANWEWATLYISKVVDHTAYGAYQKIQNKYFDDKIKESRKRFNSNLVQSSRFIRIMHQHKTSNQLSLYGLLSDQSPMLSKTNYWNYFMGVKVPIRNGPEMLAKRYDIPVVFMDTKRVKRGYYESSFKVLAEKPKDFKDYQITEMFTQELEKQIRTKPEFYFWTHKRFKHMGKEKI